MQPTLPCIYRSHSKLCQGQEARKRISRLAEARRRDGISIALGSYADGVIVSILRNVSRMPKVSAALHRLKMMRVPILGAVVSGSDEDVYSSRYHIPVAPTEE